MSKSCKGLAMELVKCLSETDCVKVSIPPNLQPFAVLSFFFPLSLSRCRGNLVKMKENKILWWLVQNLVILPIIFVVIIVIAVLGKY